MKKILIITFLFIYSQARAQLITTNPTFPDANSAVTITFNAALGNQGLKDYTGDIYAHTGVTTNNSSGGSDWRYVKTNWGTNTEETKLTRIGDNLYTLLITPSIKEYYGVPNDETILQMVFVFRSGDSSKEGKTAEGGDIFANVYEESLSVTIIKPEDNIIVLLNDQIDIEAASNLADSLILYIDNTRIQATNTSTLLHTYSVNTDGKHWIVVEAKNDSESVFDSVYCFVKENVEIKELPAGAINGINYNNDSTVTLVLNAPEKEYVYLLGDFNSWDISNIGKNNVPKPYNRQIKADTWMMYKTANGNHFWLTINNITPMIEYRYQYLIDGEIVVADPYADKILDPWNDKYIDENTYPNLIPYPEDLTFKPVSVFQTAQNDYAWQVTDFTPPKVTDMVIYEMLIRDFVETHTYKTIADTLDYLKNLGVNVLELMPINEFEGNSSWGYNPSFYFAPDKYYGPKNKLKLLVDECHKRGIAVVIDLVLNHSYGQSPFVRMYFENGKPAANNPWYNVNHNFTNPDAHWGYDFNHESVFTQALVDSINSYWMNQYKIDGFRFDFTKGFGNNIKDASDPWGSIYDADRVRLLKRMANEIWKRNSDAYVIFEHLSENDEERELANYGILLWGNMNYNYLEGAMGWNDGGKSDFSWISYKKRGWSNPHVVGYMESHDEERMVYKNQQWGNSSGNYNITEYYTSVQRVELAANFFIPIPGPKMIWQFGELGYDYSIDYNGRVGEKPIRWDYFSLGSRKRIYEVMGYLNKLKTEEIAFETTDYSLSVSSALKSIHLNHTDMNVVIIGNFDVVEDKINPNFQNTGTWYEFYSGQTVDVTNTQAEITLAPGEYRLYTTKQFDTPELSPFIGESKNTILKDGLKIYPNPVKNKLYIDNAQKLVQVSIINIFGQQVFLSRTNTNLSIISVNHFTDGIYIISGIDKHGVTYTSRFIKK